MLPLTARKVSSNKIYYQKNLPPNIEKVKIHTHIKKKKKKAQKSPNFNQKKKKNRKSGIQIENKRLARLPFLYGFHTLFTRIVRTDFSKFFFKIRSHVGMAIFPYPAPPRFTTRGFFPSRKVVGRGRGKILAPFYGAGRGWV